MTRITCQLSEMGSEKASTAGVRAAGYIKWENRGGSFGRGLGKLYVMFRH